MNELTTIKELETPIKLTRFLYFYDLLFIIGYTFVSYELLVEHVHGNLKSLYFVNCIFWGVFFIMPAYGNSRRQNWRHILNALLNMQTGKTYYGVEKEEQDEIR